MRQYTRAITDAQKIETIISQAQICRLAFFDQDHPYIVPMNFGYAAGSLYFHCAQEGRKLDLIRRDPRVGFELEGRAELDPHESEACRWGCKYQSVIGTGTAVILENAAEKRAALDIIMAHYAPGKNWAYPDEHLEKMAVIRVDIKESMGKQSRHFVES